MTEKLINDLLEKQSKGRISNKNFIEEIYKIINQHTQEQIFYATQNEYHAYIRDAFMKAYLELMNVDEVELDTVIPDDTDRSSDGEIVFNGEKPISHHLFQMEKWLYRIFKVKHDIPRYTLNREKYAKRRAYHIATTGYHHFYMMRQKEEAEKQAMFRKMQEDAKGQADS